MEFYFENAFWNARLNYILVDEIGFNHHYLVFLEYPEAGSIKFLEKVGGDKGIGICNVLKGGDHINSKFVLISLVF